MSLWGTQLNPNTYPHFKRTEATLRESPPLSHWPAGTLLSNSLALLSTLLVVGSV
jgi:hypothetical protein